MDSFLMALQVVFPLLVLLGLGYFLSMGKLLSGELADKMSKLVYSVFLPVILFYNIYTTDLAKSLNGPLILFGVCAVFILYGLLFVFIPLLEKENRRRGVLIQGIFRSNFVLFGLPVATNLCGAESAGMTTVLIAVVVPIYNILSVIALEVFRHEKPNFKAILKGIATNPLIIASVLGILVSLLPIHLPEIVVESIHDIGSIATPLALISLGATFRFKRISTNLRPLLIGVLGKLVIAPCLGIIAAILLGFRGAALGVVIAMFASPAAVSTFPMAKSLGGDGELAGQLVVLGSVLSIVTIFIWVFVLHQMAML